MSINYLSAIGIAAAICVSAGSSVAKQIEYENRQQHGASYQKLAETKGMERRGDRRDVRRTLGKKRGLLAKTSATPSRKAVKMPGTNARVVTITRRRTLLIDGPLQHRRFIQRTLIVRHGSWGSPFQ